MLKPSCSRKRTMNYEEICVEEEKGELTAKLGQVIDGRGQNLANSFFGESAVTGEAAVLLEEPNEKRRSASLTTWLCRIPPAPRK